MDSTLIPKRFVNVATGVAVSLGNPIGLFCGGAGNVVANNADGTTATFAVAAGTTLAGEFKSLAAGTSATGLVALYAQ